MGVSTKGWGGRGGRKFPKKVGQFRSQLEARNAKHLEGLELKFDFESLKIPYTVPESYRKYTPDFILENGIIVEVKGKLEPKDRAKHLLVQMQYPELDIRFVFQRPFDPINKGSPTTYAKWADKHGFKWAKLVVPEKWAHEAGPKRKPLEVLGQ
jgi:hypothetical protein